MQGDKLKQQARLSIIERMRQKGMPMSPVPSRVTPEEMAEAGEEETLNDMNVTPSLQAKLRKKKRIGPQEQGEEAVQPTDVLGGY